MFYLTNIECIRAITDPSNSVPDSVLMVIGENDLHKIFSQTLQAINKEIPDPIPYPSFQLLQFTYKSSSNKMQTIPAINNWHKIKVAFPNPKVLISPYYPL